MYHPHACRGIAALLLTVLFFSSCGESGSQPIPIIIESDMGNDVDDALALALVCNAVRDGFLDLKMVSIHKFSPTACDYVGSVLEHYGLPDVVVSYCPTPVVNEESTDFTYVVAENPSIAVIDTTPTHAAAGQPIPSLTPFDGNPVEIPVVTPSCDYPESVAEYRRILSGSEDGSMVVVSLGFGTTLALLLDSGADEYSPLSGRELVAAKVKYLSIMAGSFGSQDTLMVGGFRETLFDSTRKRSEFNVANDIPAMQKVFAEWPGEIYMNPFELGKKVMYPGDVAEQVEGNPVFDGYKAFKPMPYDRPTWDLLSVTYVLHPEMFSLSEPVTVSVDEEGYCHATPGGSHYVLVFTPDQAAALKDYLIAETTR